MSDNDHIDFEVHNMIEDLVDIGGSMGLLAYNMNHSATGNP